MNTSAVFALMAAVLFGASTPLAKLLLDSVSPVMLGGLLYLGSGVGLALVRLVRDRGWQPTGLQQGEWPWLVGAIAFGGVLGPVALMHGLVLTTGSTASLLLNLESVLTAVLAWVVFKENADRRVVAGMVAIVAGGLVLSWPEGALSFATGWQGPVSIALACLCWAIDNNLTRKVSSSDALFVAGSKGLVAGVANVSLALTLGASMPSAGASVSAMAVGLLGYGVSLVLFVLALRGLGTARTGAYFSVAPFVGAFVSLAVLGESSAVGGAFWLACALMAVGVWLHLSERHEHSHTHETMEHHHTHHHDEHHRHDHAFEWEGREPHSHLHRHEPLTHRHPHYPDLHHRHGH